MSFSLLHDKFPEMAMQEQRSFRLSDHNELPDDEYSLMELYCNDINCDCRRVHFLVVSNKTKTHLAEMSFGWESLSYYEKFMGINDPELINEMTGLSLNPLSEQSEYAPALLNIINNEVLQDRNYVKRLQRHYQLFKEKVYEEARIKNQSKTIIYSQTKTGRNEPCPCGSGKKYKKCCL